MISTAKRNHVALDRTPNDSEVGLSERRPPRPRPSRIDDHKNIPRLAWFTVTYFLANQLSLSMRPGAESESVLWLSSGVALSGFLFSSYLAWPILIVAMILVDAATVFARADIATFDFFRLVEPIVSAVLIRVLLGVRSDLPRTIDLARVVLIGAFLVPCVLAVPSAWLQESTSVQTAWQIRWCADGLGVIIALPVVFAWIRVSTLRLPKQLALELSITLLLTCLAIPILFGRTAIADSITDFPYVILPVVLWCAFRFRLEIVSVQLLAIAIAAATLGVGAEGNTSSRGLEAQVFIWTLSLSALFLNVAVTQRRNATRTTLQLRETLSQVERREVLSRVSAGIAHDFKNDLHVAMGWLEVIEQEGTATNPTVKSAIDYARSALERSTELTQRLLGLGTEPASQVSSTCLSDLVSQASRTWASIAGGRVQIRSNIPDSVWVQAPRAETEHALINLLINAKDAMPKGGEITIETADLEVARSPDDRLPQLSPGSYVEISVRDTGVGIRPQLMERVFEPFFTTKSATHGSGLGLASVDSFARQYGGTVRAESTVGVGTVITIILRRARGASAEASDEQGEVIDGRIG